MIWPYPTHSNTFLTVTRCVVYAVKVQNPFFWMPEHFASLIWAHLCSSHLLLPLPAILVLFFTGEVSVWQDFSHLLHPLLILLFAVLCLYCFCHLFFLHLITCRQYFKSILLFHLGDEFLEDGGCNNINNYYWLNTLWWIVKFFLHFLFMPLRTLKYFYFHFTNEKAQFQSD